MSQGPNGLGSSLERNNQSDPRMLRRPVTWRASSVPGGTPGYPNSIQVQSEDFSIEMQAVCTALTQQNNILLWFVYGHSPTIRLACSQDEPGLSLLMAVEHWPKHPTSRDNVTIVARIKSYGPPLTTVVMQYEWADHALDVVRVPMQYDAAAEACLSIPTEA
jgi:hypothetical protein